MSKIIPPARPRLSAGQLIEMIEKRGIEFSKHPLIIAGVRGYYTKTMGDPTKDDIGIYDDAIFLLTENMMAAFNGNTDPSKRRPGQGFGSLKGMARLQPGAWLSYKFAQHSGPSTPPYDAICQRAGPVTVMRDGITQDYEHTGNFGINIHRGSMNSTSSEGCQTIYPTQWLEFIVSAQSQAKRIFGTQWKSVTLPYVLMTHAELPAG
ncbi:hypothetical protein [Blastomonas sp.]|uniref:hypothetical protein n=1 Tax=Blastomonas sp. TaxID=1909299 RepID=UPI00391D53AF